MKIIKINKKNIKLADIDLIVDYLQCDKVVVLPTDTIYGLHTLATSEKGIRKIIKIKQRPQNFGFVHLMKSYCQVHNYARVSKKEDEYMRQFWPATTRNLQNKNIKFNKKPTTFLLKTKNKLPKLSNAGKETIAIRLPKNDFLLTILKRANIPLMSSSLNISGQELLTLNEIKKKLPILPDLVIDMGKLGKKVSRIIDISDIKNITIIRK